MGSKKTNLADLQIHLVIKNWHEKKDDNKPCELSGPRESKYSKRRAWIVVRGKLATIQPRPAGSGSIAAAMPAETTATSLTAPVALVVDVVVVVAAAVAATGGAALALPPAVLGATALLGGVLRGAGVALQQQPKKRSRWRQSHRVEQRF